MKFADIRCITILVTVAMAVGGPAIAADSHVDSTEQHIRHLENVEHQAILDQNVAALDSLFSDDLVVNTPRNTVSLKQDVLELSRAGKIHYDSFDRTVEFVRVDGNLAISMGSERLVPASGDPNAGKTVDRRFTNVWRNENGTWRLYIRHATIYHIE